MMHLPLSVTSEQLHIYYIGQEQQPVLVVDEFWPQPQQLLDFALQHGEVCAVTGGYPGLRSPAPDIFGRAVLATLAATIEQVFGVIASQVKQIDSYYSMVLTPVSELTPLQTIPHFDRAQPADLALVYYLCQPEHGGTSFYRHRRSGFEAIIPERQEDYQQLLALDFQQYGLPPKGYINGDTALFIRIASVPARFNRLLMYRCSSLHSGDIAPDYQYNLDPCRGRFTLTAFFSCNPVTG